MSEPLTNAKKRHLKSEAQRLEASLHVGKAGLSADFLQALESTFAHRELVKVRFDAFKDERKQLAAEMAAKTSSELIWLIGHVAVLYRKRHEPES
ncbi:MAG: YhbY family RNA-binding protein [Verrucomicrobia bacterium]|nr:YhbY family RNA-binding protein [Verrucomicrobiota bacterium]